MVPGRTSAVGWLLSTARLTCVLRRYGAIEQPFFLGVEIATSVGLKPISQHAKQQMAWQVGRWPLSEDSVPSGPKITEIEIAQTRNLDLKRFRIRQSQTDPHTRHGRQAVGVLGGAQSSLAPPLMR